MIFLLALFTVTLDALRGRAVATPEEIGRLFGRSARTIHRAMDRGEIPQLILGRRRLVPVPALLKLLGADPPNGDTPAVGAGASESSSVAAGEVAHG